MAIFVCLVYLVRPVFLVKKIQFVFLFIYLCDEIDLINGSEDGRGRAWTETVLSNLIINTGKKMLSPPEFVCQERENDIKFIYY
jgi:hypothetical protein